MVYKSWLHRTGNLLLISALGLGVFTNVFAQQVGADTLDKSLLTTTSRVFMPLVQSGTDVIVKQEDAQVVDTAMVEQVELLMMGASPRTDQRGRAR